jgi:hypothetical protein
MKRMIFLAKRSNSKGRKPLQWLLSGAETRTPRRGAHGGPAYRQSGPIRLVKRITGLRNDEFFRELERMELLLAA